MSVCCFALSSEVLLPTLPKLVRECAFKFSNMNFGDNFDSDFEQNGSALRNDVEPLSLYDTNSRDSGFEEVRLESFRDDAFLEEFAEIHFSQRSHVPSDFSNLIQNPIQNVSPVKKKICQRSEPEETKQFLIRRKKVVHKFKIEECNSVEPVKITSFHSEELVKLALQRSYSEPDLVADFSRNYSLPLTTSRHQDLRAIDCNTLKQLLNGVFNNRIRSFKIIDCRYPYEYNGGHIEGAVNIYTRDQCSSFLESSSIQASNKPDILIFHCEFSAERGPNLYRQLRQEDRKKNALMYPALCFPEMYILEGGYRMFYEENSNMCSPVAYTHMSDPNHSQDMLFFRQTSKTWNADVKCFSKKNIRKRTIRKFVL